MTAFIGYATLVLGLDAAIIVIAYWMLVCVPATLPFSMKAPKHAWLAGPAGVIGAGIIIVLIPFQGIFASLSSGLVLGCINSIETFNWSVIGMQVLGGIMSVVPKPK